MMPPPPVLHRALSLPLLLLLAVPLVGAQLVPPGWTVVLKTDGDETFQYNSPYWTTADVLDEASDPEAPGCVSAVTRQKPRCLSPLAPRPALTPNGRAAFRGP